MDFQKILDSLRLISSKTDPERRFAAYKWCANKLGYKGTRRQLPHCIVSVIGDAFPSGQRTGFKRKYALLPLERTTKKTIEKSLKGTKDTESDE
jgi:hypothetical protein